MKSLALVIFLGLFAAYSAQKRVKVTILYETLCPDSTKFVTEQLSPNYYHLRNYIDFELVPFGKAKSQNNGASFTCQHGQTECAGNRIQTCALNSIWNKDLQIAFVGCYMSTGDLSGFHCANKYGIEFADIMYCASTDLGRQLQLRDEKRTGQFRPSFVPTIIYNNKFDEGVQDRALYDFLGASCEMINFAAPICNGKK
ncbi:unnamed protein product [Hermetia illucens]|uniref:Uncharacterized protein n=1 Tax=Hermetia illucens TaxID=343691 RepID=A0A7R8Z0U2_HERIL|nr:GILT-like protein 1 [Hermetia illucens]CAD7092979.1 unnamed protein product [Hermetia illucens]